MMKCSLNLWVEVCFRNTCQFCLYIYNYSYWMPLMRDGQTKQELCRMHIWHWYGITCDTHSPHGQFFLPEKAQVLHHLLCADEKQHNEWDLSPKIVVESRLDDLFSDLRKYQVCLVSECLWGTVAMANKVTQTSLMHLKKISLLQRSPPLYIFDLHHN